MARTALVGAATTVSQPRPLTTIKDCIIITTLVRTVLAHFLCGRTDAVMINGFKTGGQREESVFAWRIPAG